MITLSFWWLDRPGRLQAEFVGHLHQGRYAEAQAMPSAPCKVGVLPDGSLNAVDLDGRSSVVPAANLPFKAGGGNSLAPDEFRATALGPGRNGTLLAPAWGLRLRLDNSKVCIVRAES